MIVGRSANEMFQAVVSRIYHHGNEASPRGMLTKEAFAPRIELTNPYRRYFGFKSRPFDLWYAFGELFWYLSKTNKVDFIAYYAPSYMKFSDDGETVNSAYGYLMFEKFGDQILKCVDLINNDNDTRHAIVFLREPADLYKKTKDSICTNTLHFQMRDNKLHLIVNMRSNDLMVGFMFDSFCFSMIQEIVAYMLTAKVGSYVHISNNMHIYDKWFGTANKLVEENDMIDFDLGPMAFKKPPNETYREISLLCHLEKAAREHSNLDHLNEGLNVLMEERVVTDYWQQILLLLYAKKIIMMENKELYDRIMIQLSKFQNYYFMEYIHNKARQSKMKEAIDAEDNV
jgi:thymidylate synthase